MIRRNNTLLIVNLQRISNLLDKQQVDFREAIEVVGMVMESIIAMIHALTIIQI
jgi:hypothetical protein